MKRVGEVVRTAQGLAVLRCSGGQRPDIGTTVLDDALNPVGRVVDVFGPVDRPYAAVSPGHGTQVGSLLGVKLYAR